MDDGHNHISPNDLTILSESIPGYNILELIATGGWEVYSANKISTCQTVALKLLQLDESLSGTQRHQNLERFEREAQLCTQLKHPHIVHLLDKGHTQQNQAFVVFEYVPGETLKDFLSSYGALSPKKPAS